MSWIDLSLLMCVGLPVVAFVMAYATVKVLDFITDMLGGGKWH